MSIACDSVRAAFGDGASTGSALIQEGMPCFYGWNTNVQITARSMHSGGVNVAFCDGSIHWISDYIQVVSSGGTSNLSVWDRLNASADGQPITGNEF